MSKSGSIREHELFPSTGGKFSRNVARRVDYLDLMTNRRRRSEAATLLKLDGTSRCATTRHTLGLYLHLFQRAACDPLSPRSTDSSRFQFLAGASVVFRGKEAEFDLAASPNAPSEEGLRRARER
ncbi:hypothetical protein E4U32_005254 [Claviceps aff. humidiphila group G2b]|nr:hypothetical protein E4U32_005254 [Claviceps aff. humidiphila group G2b]